MRTPRPVNENLRIQKLHEYLILDTPPEQAFDDIVSLAAHICGTPFALITLVDNEREWFKAKKGIAVKENSRMGGFCAQTILHQDVMIVSNAHTDSRFSTNNFVTMEPNIGFYAGAPVRTPTGEALGTLCVLDIMPRELSPEQIEALRMLARQTGTALEHRRKEMALADTLAKAKYTEQLLNTALDAQKELLSSANVGIISTDEQGIVVSFNRTAQRMLGYSEAEVVGKCTPSLFHDADEIAARADELSNELGQPIAPGFEAFVAKTRTGNADERQWTYIRKDGSRFPVSLSITSLHGTEGNITGFLGIAIDITGRKQAEARLKNSERFTRAVLDALSKQFCVLDESGKILEVNKPWLDFERDHDDETQTLEIGQNYLALLDAGLANNRGGEAFAKGIRSVLNGATSNFSLEYSYHNQSSQHWFTGKVILFPDQELGRIILIHENISEHKRLEQRFRQAVESAPNAIVMINESGTIVMVNLQTETSFGYSRSELIGQPVEILVPERFRDGHAGFRHAYLAAPRSRPMGAGRELFGVRKDGSEFPVEIGLSFIDDENGIIVLSSIIDITERKSANDKLKNALNEKEMLLKEVYHRVKNNLQVVSSLINLQA
ncbi:MAG: PAS domain S-box protein, partial [Methylobacter sp.]